MRVVIFVALLLLTTTSCIDITKVAPKVHTLHTTTLDTPSDLSLLQYGRDLYITKCSTCHNTLRISRYSTSKWMEVLPEMAEESKMTTAETDAVTAYIKAVLVSTSASAN
jgi:hypothetical protein